MNAIRIGIAERATPTELALDGEARAEHVLAQLHGDPDRLLRGLQDVLDADGRTVAPSVRLRSFLRRLQKRLEAST